MERTVYPYLYFAQKRFVAVWLLFLIFASIAPSVQAQERCAIVPYMKQLHERNTLFESDSHFEEWMQEKLQAQKERNSTGRTEATSYEIPVVVHIIHNGENVGTGLNLSDEQIESQITVLNEDYQRTNADASNTPTDFAAVAGSIDITFVLAKQDPNGESTTGIVRVQGSQTSWSVEDDNYALKAQSYWPAEDYLNIWVTDLEDGYLGYAQFPVSDLDGLESATDNRLTDGVVIDYVGFGSDDYGAFDVNSSYNKGRTTTHEIGHFLGLRHIWGDDGGLCTGSDYVDDTPEQGGATYTCPTSTLTSCGSSDMYQNYMDYTDDECMNLFTEDQIGRMEVVLAESPRRTSLLTSAGLVEPGLEANDLGISSINTPQATSCDTDVTPNITVKNFGTNTVTSAQIRLYIDDEVIETVTMSETLETDETTTVEFSTQTGLSTGSHTFKFWILTTNGGTDGSEYNDEREIDVEFPESIAAPFIEKFTTEPTDWIINNPDDSYTWEYTTATSTSSSNKAMYLNFFEYESEGEIDMLSTPVFDLSDVTVAYLSFDVAYATYGSYSDALQIYVLTDCNSSIYDGTLIYEKSGSTLQTVTRAPSGEFSPTSSSEWRTDIKTLTDFIGYENVQLVFVGVNGYGNNLYIDNISVITDSDENLTLTSVVTPSPVTCETDVVPQLVIANNSDEDVSITYFEVEVTVNDGDTEVVEVNTSLAVGESDTFELNTITLEEGTNTITFDIVSPNGLIDNDRSDNEATVVTIVNTASDQIPLREDFEDDYSDIWVFTNPTEDGETWEATITGATDYGTSVEFNAYTNTTVGDEGWLVSPTIDMSKYTKSSVFFDLAYAYNGTESEQLILLASTNCGVSYDSTLLDVALSDLATASATSSWAPESDDDWSRHYVNLSNLAGQASVRLAFIVSNANGNNAYIDNIEFFTSDDSDPTAVEDPFLIYGTTPSDDNDFIITFNLSERSNVTYDVLDITGRTLAHADITDVLNQTYVIDAGHVATGVYIVRLAISGKYYAQKVMLQKH